MEDWISAALHYGSIFLAVLWVLVFATNIIVELLKAVAPMVPGNILAMGVAMAVTMTAFLAVCSAYSLDYTWYWVAGAVVMGLFVGYAAMFGFDKFREAWEKLKGLGEK